MSDDNKKRRDPHVFDDSKLRLYAPAIKSGAKQVSLQVKLIENNPTLSVDYGYATDKGHQVKHDTPLNPTVFNQICQLLKRVAAAKGQAAYEMDNWGHPWLWDKEQGKNLRSKEMMNLSRVEIGKHENGSVYLKYCAVKKPEIEFTFSDDTYHKLLRAGESDISVSSSMAALAWADTMANIYNTYYAINWVEPEWRKKFRMEQASKNGGKSYGGGGGGNKPAYNGGNNNTNSGSSGGYSPEYGADDHDDEIPF